MFAWKDIGIKKEDERVNYFAMMYANRIGQFPNSETPFDASRIIMAYERFHSDTMIVLLKDDVP